MAENVNRPVSAKLYQSPSDSGQHTSATYRPPGSPQPRDPAQSVGVRRNADAHTTEPATPPPHGSRVQHTKSGQQGTVVDNPANAYGHAVPHVVWDGEEASWPQGVSANALRVVGSTPSDLYTYNQDATSSRPMRGTGGGQGQ